MPNFLPSDILVLSLVVAGFAAFALSLIHI